MAKFGLTFLEKMVLGAWGYGTVKGVIEDHQEAQQKKIDTAHYTIKQAKYLMQVAASSSNYVNWHRHMDENGFSTNEIISTVCHYTPEQFFRYFGIHKPI